MRAVLFFWASCESLRWFRVQVLGLFSDLVFQKVLQALAVQYKQFWQKFSTSSLVNAWLNSPGRKSVVAELGSIPFVGQHLGLRGVVFIYEISLSNPSGLSMSLNATQNTVDG